MQGLAIADFPNQFLVQMVRCEIMIEPPSILERRAAKE
jgi:hypothetical protein